MNKIFIFALLLSVSLCLKISHQETSAGGWNVVAANSTIDNFIRNAFPGLNGAELMQAKTQFVSGTKYLYTYQRNNTFWRINVFEQPWTNTREITGVERKDDNNQSGTRVERTFTTNQDSRVFTDIARSVVL